MVANRLSVNQSVKVVLIEADRRHHSPWILIPGGDFRPKASPAFDWCVRAEPDLGLADVS